MSPYTILARLFFEEPDEKDLRGKKSINEIFTALSPIFEMRAFLLEKDEYVYLCVLGSKKPSRGYEQLSVNGKVNGL